jgi:Kdo2-lipid IVA 3' secondary acyltransferase
MSKNHNSAKITLKNFLYQIKNFLHQAMQSVLLFIAPWFVHCYISLLFWTSKIEIRASAETKKVLLSNKRVVLAFWHNRLLIMPHIVAKIYKRRGVAVISRHKDGEYVSRFLATYGHGSARGSSNTEGFAALKGAISALKQEKLLAITPDGPRGPRYHINGNITAIAAKTNTPIVCACYSATKKHIFKTWDHFLLPLIIWKQKIVIELSYPMYVDDLEFFSTKRNITNITNIKKLIAKNDSFKKEPNNNHSLNALSKIMQQQTTRFDKQNK